LRGARLDDLFADGACGSGHGDHNIYRTVYLASGQVKQVLRERKKADAGERAKIEARSRPWNAQAKVLAN
jgi:hypothetical protein